MKKLAIFDMDGVLADTSTLHTLALRSAIQQYAGSEASSASYLDASDGVRTATKLARLQREFDLSNEKIRSIDECKKVLTLDLIKSLDKNHIAYEGLVQLKGAGVLIGVASNSRRQFVVEVLTATGLVNLIDMYVAGDQIQNPKPDPEIFTTIMNSLGYAPRNVTIFEDSEIGLAAARATGAHVIQVNPQRLVTLEQILSVLSHE